MSRLQAVRLVWTIVASAIGVAVVGFMAFGGLVVALLTGLTTVTIVRRDQDEHD